MGAMPMSLGPMGSFAGPVPVATNASQMHAQDMQVQDTYSKGFIDGVAAVARSQSLSTGMPAGSMASIAQYPGSAYGCGPPAGGHMAGGAFPGGSGGFQPTYPNTYGNLQQQQQQQQPMSWQQQQQQPMSGQQQQQPMSGNFYPPPSMLGYGAEQHGGGYDSGHPPSHGGGHDAGLGCSPRSVSGHGSIPPSVHSNNAHSMHGHDASHGCLPGSIPPNNNSYGMQPSPYGQTSGYSQSGGYGDAAHGDGHGPIAGHGHSDAGHGHGAHFNSAKKRGCC